MPSILEDLLSCDAATALETVRRAACTGANVVLAQPPPAMLHPSKYPATNILYCGQKPCPVEDGPYATLGPGFDWTQEGYCCVGAVMFDVCEGMSRPAVVFTEDHEQMLRVRIYVHDAPLAAMEAELFNGNGLPSGFEAKWLGDQATAAKELRHQIGTWVRKQGYDSMPDWMHDKDNCMCLDRPGVLPLLRVRQANTEEEEKLLEDALCRWHKPSQGVAQLKDFLEVAREGAVEVLTTYLQCTPPPDADGDHCEAALKHSVIAPLALTVLKYLKDDDYYGVVVEEEDADDKEDEKDDEEDDEGEEGDTENAEVVRRVVEDIEVREGTAIELQKEGPALAYRGNKLLMRLVGPTLRACDSKVLVAADSEFSAACAITEHAFGDTDASIVKKKFPGLGFPTMCTEMARDMGRRYAFLLMTKEEDGSLGKVHLATHMGMVRVAFESVTRYVLCPWVLPLVADGMTMSEVKVKGVVRECFRLTEVKRVEALHEQRGSIPEEIMKFIRDASEGLKSIPSLASRVGSLEMQFTAGVPVAPAAPAAVPATVAPVREMSETQRGFKRMVAQIEAYDAALERNTRAR